MFENLDDLRDPGQNKMRLKYKLTHYIFCIFSCVWEGKKINEEPDDFTSHMTRL